MKYYVTYYLKNQPQDSETFETWIYCQYSREAGQKFVKALDKNPDLENRSFLKRIKQESIKVITLTIKTEDSCESLPVRDDARVKDVSLYLFNNYTCKGIDYKLNIRKNKELN